MAVTRNWMVVAIAASMAAAPTSAQTGRTLATVIAELDQSFVCPQFRPDDAARRTDMLDFSRAMASVGPAKISYRKAAYIYSRMLERHNCAPRGATVAAVETTAAGVDAAGGTAAAGAPD